jgi:hypothetical protein
MRLLLMLLMVFLALGGWCFGQLGCEKFYSLGG